MSYNEIIQVLVEIIQCEYHLIVTTIIILCFWYYLFWRPFDYYRDFTTLSSEGDWTGSSNPGKRRLINELRRRNRNREMLTGSSKTSLSLPPVFPNGWYVILESDELPGLGTKEVSLLGLTLAAWRGSSGKAYVSDAYCPHLGANLAEGGQVYGECIECPYHGWRFKSDPDPENCEAKCVNIPNTSQDSIPTGVRLRMWNTVEMNGFIYLWFHAEGHKPSWEPEEIPEIANGSWKYRGRSELIFASHIQDIHENGADFAHINIVHKPFVLSEDGGGLTRSGKQGFSFGWLSHTWSDFHWEPLVSGTPTSFEENRKDSDPPTLSHRALLSFTQKMCLFNRFHFMPLRVIAHQIGPGEVVLRWKALGGEGVLFFMVTPIAPLLMRITHRFYSSPGLIHPLGMLMVWAEAAQLARDIVIWNRKTFLPRPALTKEDKSIKSYRRWFSQFYSEHSPRLGDAKSGILTPSILF